jgi:hypothetical protein
MMRAAAREQKVTPDNTADRTLGAAAASVGWRAALRRDVSLLLLFKAIALALLWWLFFSPAHRAAVDPAAIGRHLALKAAAPGTDAGGGAGKTGDQP